MRGAEDGPRSDKKEQRERGAQRLLRRPQRQGASDGKIDILVGRELEIERTIQILCRRSKNNPLFVGDPGVGKTAIAEGPGAAHRRAARCRRSCATR